MKRKSFRFCLVTGWVVLLILTVAVCGCRVLDPAKDDNRSLAVRKIFENPSLQVEVKLEIATLLRGTTGQSKKAEEKLKEFGHAALYYLGGALKEKQTEENEGRLIEIMVAILLEEAASMRDDHRAEAVGRLVELDKRYGVIHLLLIRLETAAGRLSNSIFKVIEKCDYISGQWAWADQAWEELSTRFQNIEDIIKRYIGYKLRNLPPFDTFTMSWDQYDQEYAFTVLSEVVIGEGYKDIAPIYVELLEVQGTMVRQMAARVLGHLKYLPAAEKLIEKLVDDPSFYVRAAAAVALGRMKAEQAASTSLVVLLRKGELLGSKVCWALGEMRSQKAVRPLVQIVDKPPAMLALGKIGNQLAIKSLIRVMETTANSMTRAAAARALGNFHTREVLDALKRVHSKESSRHARTYLLFSIFQMETEANKAAVQAHLTDFEIEFRLGAMVLLTSKGYLQNLPKMMELVETQNPDERARQWGIIRKSFESIPEYRPYGLTHARTSDINEIKTWHVKNKSGLYWDKATMKFKVR